MRGTVLQLLTVGRGGMLCLLLACAGGCATIRVTDPSRTATEQFLMTEAVTRAVEQLSAEPLRDKQVFVDGTYLGPIEQPFVLGQLRAKLLSSGVRLVNKREEAKIIVEARAGSVGIDRTDFLVGIPPLALPTLAGSTSNVAYITPELAFLKNQKQRGFASVAFVAYWAGTGEIVASSGPYVGQTYREDHWILGIGPRTLGNIPPAERAK